MDHSGSPAVGIAYPSDQKDPRNKSGRIETDYPQAFSNGVLFHCDLYHFYSQFSFSRKYRWIFHSLHWYCSHPPMHGNWGFRHNICVRFLAYAGKGAALLYGIYLLCYCSRIHTEQFSQCVASHTGRRPHSMGKIPYAKSDQRPCLDSLLRLCIFLPLLQKKDDGKVHEIHLSFFQRRAVSIAGRPDSYESAWQKRLLRIFQGSGIYGRFEGKYYCIRHWHLAGRRHGGIPCVRRLQRRRFSGRFYPFWQRGIRRRIDSVRHVTSIDRHGMWSFAKELSTGRMGWNYAVWWSASKRLWRPPLFWTKRISRLSRRIFW